MHCPKCGERATEGAAFCWACEAPLNNLPAPEDAARAPQPPADSAGAGSAGKTEELLGFAVFMIGVLWACGASAGSQAEVNYTWPAIFLLAGVALWIGGRVRRRRRPKPSSQ